MMTSINPEKFLPKLLELLSKAKAVAGTEGEAVLRFENIKEQLDEVINDGLLPKVKLLDQTLLRQFTSLERRLGKIIVEAKTTYSTVEAINEALNFMDKDVKQIKDLMHLGKPMLRPDPIPEPQAKWIPVFQLYSAKKMSEEWSQLGLQDRFHDSSAMTNMRRTYENLESLELKLCLLSFSVFPEGAVVKKRPLIYWWIGEGFIRSTQQKTAEEVGEEIFQNLVMRKGLNVQPHLKASSSSTVLVNSCTIHPWIRRMLISLASEAKLFHFDSSWSRMPSYDSSCRHVCLVFGNPIPQGNDGPKVDDLLTLFNVSEQYLGMKKEWLNKLKKVKVLQLGRWQSSANYHIEVEDETSLKGLGSQKHLKYLSLRGISRVSQLSPSILNLVSLQILDLRACHNLETLPSDISSLRKLTHLDLSECYLLEGMPKGIEKLSSLQVLKGFLIGSSQKTPCRLGDLAKLTNLKRLSIHMGNEAVVQEGEFKKLEEMLSLRRLKISWGVVRNLLKEKIIEESLKFSFPPDLEKLDLQGIPIERVPQWLNPSQLKNLKKLYIKGGKLVSLDHGKSDRWMVENLRLKYLAELDIDLPRLKELFPHLQHLEKIKCHEIEKDVYDDDIVF
ncbi:disease resistance RPP13-like protein 4 [Rosa rugosa]|uniref:disease resistance RPP13-like protein 4 n=1 Tax=Rosa rugosa TaxID=74645 RepID=UPI002B407CDD|nr:disease resistance RPP13-like protein 4 [Rosa rugosa]XP_062022024.1 disease resistance RPP13-like protein 4 [Rosa rugosa]